MKQFLTYECNSCKKGGIVEYDDQTESGIEYDFTAYAPMLAHDRCADFECAKAREIRRVDQVLIWLARKLTDDNATNAEAREKARVALVKATRAFARAICHYYRKPFQWEPDFVAMILEKPEKWFYFLNYYEKAQMKP